MPIKGITYQKGTREPEQEVSKFNPISTLHRYSNGFKLAILDQLNLGSPHHAIARSFGVARKTVQDIQNDSRLKELVNDEADRQRKKHFSKIIFHYADLFLTGIKVEAIEKMPVSQRVWCFGVLYDKYRLASGQSTENLNVFSISSNLNQELEKLSQMKAKLMERIDGVQPTGQQAGADNGQLC